MQLTTVLSEMSSNSPHKCCIYLCVDSGWNGRNVPSLSSFISFSTNQSILNYNIFLLCPGHHFEMMKPRHSFQDFEKYFTIQHEPLHFLLKIRVLGKLSAIDNCLESLFSLTECHSLYQPQSRVAPVPRRSWPTQNRFHGFLHVYFIFVFCFDLFVVLIFFFFFHFFLIFICYLCVVYIFWGFLCERERI